METKERYGRFVLQSEDARTSAGSFWRAVQLGASGYERHVELFRTELLGAEHAQTVANALQTGLQIQNAQIAKGFEAGRLDATAFLACEFIEGRSVGALLERSQSEGHPFAVDHALLIASKAAAALEAAQTRKQTHGFLLPDFIHVSHDGEVSVRAFGLPPQLLKAANSVGVREALFLAPEVDAVGPLDVRADVFSLGVGLFEMLTGSPLPRSQPTKRSVEAARVAVPGGDGVPLPKALTTLLIQTLAEDLSLRFKDASTFKKAVDTLLFSGDYSPTTFNLAFFMHTLFRDEGDRDVETLKTERSANYRPYLAELNRIVSAPAPAPAQTRPSTPAGAPPQRSVETVRPEAARPETVRPDSGRIARPSVPPAPPTLPPAQVSSADETVIHAVAAEKKTFPIVPVVLGVLAVIGVAVYLLTQRGPSTFPPAATPAMNAAEIAALARVKELESRLASMLAEKAAAEQKAAEEAKKIVEAQARARGRAVDPAELQKAQDEARKKAQVDQEAKLKAERQKIDDERKKADDAKAAAEPSKTPDAPPPPASPSATAAVVPSAPTPPPPAPAPAGAAPTPVSPPAAPGVSGVVDLGDPGVVAPQLVSQARLDYPPVARAQRISGTVVVSALIDEAGSVVETRLVRGGPTNSGLNQAALDNVKKRKYKPATQNGKPCRVWIAIQIDFKL